MQGKNFDGSWAKLDDGWTEGDHWVYTWSVLHDIPGLMELMGGAGPFTAKLDQHFNGGHNRHDNEPSHHIGYLYDYGGQPWKTQAVVRKIAESAYSNQPDGIQGNEDCGQMSAWYVFTAMGFYPVNPASGDYMIGSPMFSKVSLNLPNGKTFVISADGNSGSNIYIQSATMNGQALNAPVLTYKQIVDGGTLHFVMGAAPSSWGSNWKPSAISSTRESPNY
ncbi:putative alpha-1,2-mannosidase [Edaphobacter lichenicola]|uniref:Alpha-1,2-mannosidase n=1 Tax=Tunturiibacter lichenicola TaxID=2051959 RepID=A0A7W8J6W6_9BACT|nr:putative alpha-1,2-mannosidase [Edaphobacter lichenicola]